jgi:hypothetical protein
MNSFSVKLVIYLSCSVRYCVHVSCLAHHRRNSCVAEHSRKKNVFPSKDIRKIKRSSHLICINTVSRQCSDVFGYQNTSWSICKRLAHAKITSPLVLSCSISVLCAAAGGGGGERNLPALQIKLWSMC